MTIILHPLAEQDFEETAPFYEREGSPLAAARFIAKFHRVVQLSQTLESDRQDQEAARAFRPRAFFTILCCPFPLGIRVQVVKHDRRQPNYGGERH